MANTTLVPLVAALQFAGVAPTPQITVQPVKTPYESASLFKIAHNGMNAGAVGAPFGAFKIANLFVQVEGTYGVGGSAQVEGSNDGVNWHKLSPAASTSAGFMAALAAGERPMLYRMNCTAGDSSTSLNATAWAMQ